MLTQFFELTTRPESLFMLGFLIILVNWAPYAILLDHSAFLVRDNLDSFVAWYKVLFDSRLLFAPNATPVPQLMGGLPRGCLPTEFNVTVLLIKTFGHVGAPVVERLLISGIGFIGMYLLLAGHLIPGDENRFLHLGIALAFGLLPFWPCAGLSVSGLPLIGHAFLTLEYSPSDPMSWIIIALYPFYASLVHAGFFLVLTLGSIVACSFLISGALSASVVGGIALLCGLFLITHYRLFFQFIGNKSHRSHRIECAIAERDIVTSAKNALDLLWRGHFHNLTFHRYLILPCCLLGLILMDEQDRNYKLSIAILAFLLVTSVFFGIYQWRGISGATRLLTVRFPMQLDRFYWLHPLCWYCLFAIGLEAISGSGIGSAVAVTMVILQVLCVAFNHELRTNKESFRQFFAEQLFADIKKFIGLPLAQYRIASFGLHPAVTQYNGFYTLDGYLADYPLTYKHQFRRIIAPILDRNEEKRSYYDAWGNRAYIFLCEDEVDEATGVPAVRRLEIDYEAFKAMGGKFIFSVVEFDPIDNREMKLLKKFTSRDSMRHIYVYGVEA